MFADKEAKEFVTELFNAVAKEDLKKIAELMQQDTAKYLVYSTYAIQYISKITTTYGDYLDSVIYLNKFILSKYPQIILHKQGEPYESRFENVNSGYHRCSEDDSVRRINSFSTRKSTTSKQKCCYMK